MFPDEMMHTPGGTSRPARHVRKPKRFDDTEKRDDPGMQGESREIA